MDILLSMKLAGHFEAGPHYNQPLGERQALKKAAGV
jgi:hypothetical protein